MRLVFASSNPHKVAEIAKKIALQADIIEIIGLQEIGCSTDIPETQATIEGNALQKARFVYENYGLNCFGEDTGLEIAALNGEPGVYSARYAGEAKSTSANMDLVLQKMAGVANRNARFKTVIALILDGKEHLFEGIIQGTIGTEKIGNSGFGYDPLFTPSGYDLTFADMPLALKNQISHRALAVDKLLSFLTTYAKN